MARLQALGREQPVEGVRRSDDLRRGFEQRFIRWAEILIPGGMDGFGDTVGTRHGDSLNGMRVAHAGGSSAHNDETEALAPPHPYPGWQPTGAGDPNALLAWIDHDLKGHDPVIDRAPRPSRGEREKPELAKDPIQTGISLGHSGHVAMDGAIDTARGGTEVENWGQVTKDLGHEMSEVMAGDAKFATSTMASNAIMGPLSILGGIWEGYDAYKEWRHGDKGNAIVGGLGALSSVGTGAGSIAALAGSGAAATAAPVAGSFGLGLEVGHYGNEEVKELGWLHNSEGEAESPSEWAGNAGKAADDATNHWITKHVHSHLLGRALGTGAGLVTTAGASIPAAAMAVGGAAVGGAKAVGRAASWGASKAQGAMSNALLAHHFANYDGIDSFGTGGARGLADYESARQAAVQGANDKRKLEYWNGVRTRIDADPDGGFFEAAREQAEPHKK